MKTFYQLTSKGFKLMEKLEIALENLAELGVSSVEVEEALCRNYYHLFILFKEYHDMEFCDVDIYRIYEGTINLHDLESQDLIKQTYNDND